MDRLAIAISIYKPDRPLLDGLLAVLATLPFPLYLHVDGPVGEAITQADLDRLRHDPRLRVAQSPVNQGIAAVLNAMARRARAEGCASILYFDQDSAPSPDLPAQLLAAMERLEARGERPATIGPRPVAHDTSISKAPRYGIRNRIRSEGSAQAVHYVITSGSLTRLATFDEVGPFEERFRIDAVDVEWCFRAWAKGRSVWMLGDAEMPHRVGGGVLRMGPIAFPDQNPLRMQFYIRNQVRMTRLSHVPLPWKLRTLAYLPLQALVYVARKPGNRRKLAGLFLKAAWSGLRGA